MTLRGRLLVAVTGAIAALPEGPLTAAADSIGELWYRVAPARAEQTRVNLRRVCAGLAATNRGPARARRAATDDAELERLVRACFRHTVRYYLEVARASGYTIDEALSRMTFDTPDEVRDAFHSGRQVIIAGMHFGAIELPVVFISASVGHRVMAPMETLPDPAVAAWFRETRSRVGVKIVPVRNARRAMLDALRQGESVGMVNDRDLLGGGLLVPLFGHPAPIPPGCSLLSLETGVPIYAAACRRLKGGRYAGRVVHVRQPGDGPKRQRLTELTANIAVAFEELVADAPEQWWGAAHAIWPDLVVGAHREHAA
ncbi:MAG: lysophospholipid acyltransferase family protein [Chloroflexota bacterium]